MGGLLNKDLPYGGGSAIDFAESIVHEIPISIIELLCVVGFRMQEVWVGFAKIQICEVEFN